MKTSVHSKFVSKAMKTGDFVELWSANGQKMRYSSAKVKIALNEKEQVREVAVAADLPEDVLLEVDVPLGNKIILRLSTEDQQEALKLLQSTVKQRTRQPEQTNSSELGQMYAVTTRAQARRQTQERENQQSDSAEEEVTQNDSGSAIPL